MKNIFTQHPHSIDETYWQHFCFASKFGGKLFLAAIACVIHAIFPFWFKQTGSNLILKMTEDFVGRMTCLDSRVARIKKCLDEKESAI